MEIYNQFLEDNNLDKLVLNVLKLDDNEKAETVKFLEKN